MTRVTSSSESTDKSAPSDAGKRAAPAESAGGNTPRGNRRSRDLKPRQAILTILIAAVVLAGVLAGAQWVWGIFSSQQVTFLERYPDGSILAEVTVTRQRAASIDKSLTAGDKLPPADWYWVPEFHGFHEKTRKLANHGFFRPFPVVSGDCEQDQRRRDYPGQIREGRWQSYYEDGTLASEGDYIAGMRTGEWNFYYPNGKQQWRGSYRQHRMHGDWHSFGEDGVMNGSLTFEDGLRNGYELTLDRSGKVRVRIEWKNGVEDGMRTYYHPDATTIHSEWQLVDGQIHGRHRQWDPQGNLLVDGQYEEDKKHGLWIQYLPNGRKISEQTYYQDRLHGHEIIWYPEGPIKSEGEYRDDRQEGRWVSYNNKGEMLFEGNYVDGARHGTWKFFDADGKVKQVEYDHGKVVTQPPPASKPAAEQPAPDASPLPPSPGSAPAS